MVQTIYTNDVWQGSQYASVIYYTFGYNFSPQLQNVTWWKNEKRFKITEKHNTVSKQFLTV